VAFASAAGGSAAGGVVCRRAGLAYGWRDPRGCCRSCRALLRCGSCCGDGFALDLVDGFGGLVVVGPVLGKVGAVCRGAWPGHGRWSSRGWQLCGRSCLWVHGEMLVIGMSVVQVEVSWSLVSHGTVRVGRVSQVVVFFGLSWYISGMVTGNSAEAGVGCALCAEGWDGCLVKSHTTRCVVEVKKWVFKFGLCM
jgi:hypothetical protein